MTRGITTAHENRFLGGIFIRVRRKNQSATAGRELEWGFGLTRLPRFCAFFTGLLLAALFHFLFALP